MFVRLLLVGLLLILCVLTVCLDWLHVLFVCGFACLDCLIGCLFVCLSVGPFICCSILFDNLRFICLFGLVARLFLFVCLLA